MTRQSVGRLVRAAAVILATASGTGLSPQASGASAVARTSPPLLVAAATDVRFALEEVANMFEAETNTRVTLTFGSSGQLAAQIEQGAPYDVFFSADEGFVASLARHGLVERQTVQLYAIGRIVLWVRRDSAINIKTGLAALLDPRVRFVAIANPDHAPYGRAAIAALRSAGLLTPLQPKLVVGENVNQAFQLVQTGNADAGIVALALALVPASRDTGRSWLIPAAWYPPLRQAVAVASRSSQRDHAAAFVAFVTGPSGRAVLRRYGFVLPGETF